MRNWYRRRYIELLGSIYIYNEHRGYTALDRVLQAVRARWPEDQTLIARIERHRFDERKHYLMFRRWFERRGRIFRIIETDEPSHWAPYDYRLRTHGCRQPTWWERAIDGFIHGELLFLKLPLLFLSPRLGQRTAWPDEPEQAQQRIGPARSIASS